MAGVERRMLDRRRGDGARTPSIVRYAPGSGCTIWVKTGHLPATLGPHGRDSSSQP